MTKVAICQPLYGPTPAVAHISMVSAVAKAVASGIDIEMRFVMGSYIDLARNELVATTLADGSDVTHLFFIDQDVVLPNNVISSLLAHDLDVVGAIYYIKNPPYFPCALTWDENDLLHFVNELSPGLNPVGSIGLGATLIKREVFTKMAEHYADVDIDVSGNHRPGWFVINGIRFPMGEDTHFAWRCRELGIQQWLDADLECGHESSEVITSQHYRLYREQNNG